MHLHLVEEEHPRASRQAIEHMHSENFANWLLTHVSI